MMTDDAKFALGFAGAISRIERGKRDPQISTVQRLAVAVKVQLGRHFD
jgi:transcriptional regulator with XRE-family HTH domain